MASARELLRARQTRRTGSDHRHRLAGLARRDDRVEVAVAERVVGDLPLDLLDGDRLVIDVRGKGAGYTVRYVSAVVGTSGLATPLRGGADIQVTVNAPAQDGRGNATYRPAVRSEAVNVAGFTTFRQVAYVDSFESRTTFGLGVRARLPFRVFSLDGPGTSSRLVIDVAHRW